MQFLDLPSIFRVHFTEETPKYGDLCFMFTLTMKKLKENSKSQETDSRLEEILYPNTCLKFTFVLCVASWLSDTLIDPTCH